ncbi:MAG TPA: HD-GYP domain-containing protein [Gammaproteobacteria bacterium]|nr:HD-GYP domain-containing protein [Gammaproteobacteria bacterium]
MVEYTQEKIPVQDLLEGMFVAKLDRPWVGTPFPIQGFHVQGEDDIKKLGLYCKHVYVDVAKSRIPVYPRLRSLDTPRQDGRQDTLSLGKVRLAVNEEVYEKKRPFKQEIHTAGKVHRDISRAVDQLMDKVSMGKPIALKAARKVADRMVDSIARNPDAFIWIARIRDKDEYSYSHCVRATIWAVTFGRHLGLSRERLEHLALGVLFSEVGKTRLPDKILQKKGRLTAEEFEVMKKHVNYGVAILRDTKGMHPEVLDVVANHHERHNGSGYPRGLKGNQIPLLGKIAGIVDFYDAVTCPRQEEMALSPSEAMIKLHDLRDRDFQAELVDEFIQAIGIYPTGSLIELSTGEVGVITEQNAGRRLRPRVLLILDRHKQPLRKMREIDLQKVLKDKEGHTLNIAACLPEGSYGIDLSAFRKNFIGRLLGVGNPLFRH